MAWWWWPSTPHRSDDEIAERVAAMVAAGEITAAAAPMYERALRSEADGKGYIMRDPKIRPKPPRRPSWER